MSEYQPMTRIERKRFNDLRKSITRRIESAQSDFRRAGEELAEIRDGLLYRESYRTFEEFCLSEWGLTRQRAYQLIDASNCKPLVDNERQCRELRGLPFEDAQAVVHVAEASNPGSISAAKIRTARDMLEEATRGLSGKDKARAQVKIIREAEERIIADGEAALERDRRQAVIDLLADLERRLNRLDRAAAKAKIEWAGAMGEVRAAVGRLSVAIGSVATDPD